MSPPSIIGTLYYGFNDFDRLTPPEWVGLKNYRLIGGEPRILPEIRNTMLFAFGTVPAGVITSLLLAVLVNRAIKRIYFFRSMFYLPVVSSFVSVQLIWLWMYEPQFGLANEFLIWLGLPTSKWLRGPETALLSIIIMSNWKNMGLNMVICLAGRQSIPPDLYEAAEIDGAGRISKMFRIVIPLLAATTYFVVIVYFIVALQVFVQVLLMTCAEGTARCGGPLDSTTTIVLLIYDEAFAYLQMGFAAALTFLLFVVIGVKTLINSKLLAYEIGYLHPSYARVASFCDGWLGVAQLSRSKRQLG